MMAKIERGGRLGVGGAGRERKPGELFQKKKPSPQFFGKKEGGGCITEPEKVGIKLE
jgi:hypothetical protein